MNPKQRLEKISELVKAGKLQKAALELQNLLSEHPNFIPGQMELGRTYRKLGERQQALETFQQVERENPENIHSKLEIATDLQRLGEPDTAAQKLKEILEIDPNCVGCLYELGKLHKQKQEFEIAKPYYKKALEINPAHIWAAIQLATIFRETDEFEAAEQLLRTTLTHCPNQLNILINLGHLEEKRQNYEAALSYFQQASEAHPDNINPLLKIIDVLLDLHRLDEAESHLGQLIKRYPKNIPALMRLGFLARKKNQRNQALEWFRQALEKAQSPDQAMNAQQHIAEELRDLHQLDEALEILQKLSEEWPTNIRTKMILGSILQKKLEFTAAIDVYQQVLQIQPEHLNARFTLSQILKESGQVEAALENLKVTAKYHPDTINSQLKTIEILRSLHRLDEAATQMNQLFKQHPEDFQVLMNLGRLLRQQGQRDQALKWFQAALENAQSPNQRFNAQLDIAAELVELNQLEQATETLQQLLEQLPIDTTRIKMLLAGLARKQLNWHDAIDLYQDILQHHPQRLGTQIELARTLSQLNRVEEAISILKQIHQVDQKNIQALMMLGQLARGEEDLEGARYWYEMAYQCHPHKPGIYSGLADVMYLQGEIDAAMSLLEEAQQRISDTVELPLKLANLKVKFGYPDKGYDIYQEACQKFPHHIPLQLQFCQLQLQLGNFAEAIAILDNIKADSSNTVKQIEKLRGNIALCQFDLEQAEYHYRQAISITPSQEHTQLAHILMLMGQIDEAHQQLILATKQISVKESSGHKAIPLKGHIAVIINQLRMNPLLLSELQSVQEEIGQDRLLILASIIAKEPEYLGASLYLIKELRQQEIFTEIRNFLPKQLVKLSTIPKRIIQFWDDPVPPPEIEEISQSWIRLNPGYEYIRFSLYTAVRFIEQHYDTQVIQAFLNCEHPATQADLFRLLYLNKMGGFYADSDDRCRKSLDQLVESNAELIVYQEQYASIGNNFLGCIPKQPMIQIALYKAVDNLLNYTTEGPWFETGPGLLTSSVCRGLLPYIAHADYRAWPRLIVLRPEELRSYVWPHIQLPYKQTKKSWVYETYRSHKKNIKQDTVLPYPNNQTMEASKLIAG